MRISRSRSDLESVRQAQRNNIFQAGIQPSKETYRPVDAYLAKKEEADSQHKTEVFLAFMEGRDAGIDLPKRRNVMQSGIKQAAIVRNHPSDIEMLTTFLEFSGLS